jgi:hypothetical protein
VLAVHFGSENRNPLPVGVTSRAPTRPRPRPRPHPHVPTQAHTDALASWLTAGGVGVDAVCLDSGLSLSWPRGGSLCLCLCLRCAELGCALQVGVGPTGARPNLNIAIVWCGWSAREQGKSSRQCSVGTLSRRGLSAVATAPPPRPFGHDVTCDLPRGIARSEGEHQGDSPLRSSKRGLAG